MNIILTALTAAAATGDSVQVPFHFLKPNIPLIMIETKVNGHGPLEFIVDTGNGGAPVLLSPEVAADLKIAGKEEVNDGYTVDLHQNFTRARLDSFEIGPLKSPPIGAAIAPAISQLAERLNSKIDGNVGYPFLKNYALTLDFKRSMLSLSHDGPKGLSVPITVSDKAPLIRVDVVANDKKLTFVLDTGASACCISRKAATELGLELGAQSALNGSGKANSQISNLRTLAVGGRKQDNVRVAVADFVETLGQKLGFKVDGVLGHNFWSNYTMTIDYPRKRLIFQDPQ